MPLLAGPLHLAAAASSFTVEKRQVLASSGRSDAGGTPNPDASIAESERLPPQVPSSRSALSSHGVVLIRMPRW